MHLWQALYLMSKQQLRFDGGNVHEVHMKEKLFIIYSGLPEPAKVWLPIPLFANLRDNKGFVVGMAINHHHDHHTM